MIGRRCLSLFLIAILANVAVAFAQTTASIEGAVTDSTGGALPGVSVVVTNEETGITRDVVTDVEGRYVARDLSLGLYKVEASLQGFTTSSRKGIQLTIGRQASVDFQLGVGELSETVEVTGDAPLVDTKSSGVASFVSREQMNDLPLNARDFSQLIDLQAGTVHVRIDNGGQANAGESAGARISVSGARPSANVFVLDGTEIQTAYGTLPSGVGGATLGLEAVQEFKVLSNNYSAQYGRSVGGTVVAATRSGTNAFHGTGYLYHRDDTLNARNYFDPAVKPEFKRNQYGAGFGGPIIKNRTFFFGNYERLQENLPRNMTAAVPTALARQGILPTSTVAVSPLVKPYVDLYPLPNGRDFGDGTAEYLRTDEKPTHQTYTSVRVDHHLNDQGSFFVRYTSDISDSLDPNPIPIIANTSVSTNHYVTSEFNRVLSSRLVNQSRFGFTQTQVGTGVQGLNLPPESMSFAPGRPFGTIVVTGLANLSGGAGDNTDTVNAYILGDDLTYDQGKHSLHVGGTFTFLHFDRVNASERYGGQFEFGSLTSFLTNSRPTRLRIAGTGADPERLFRSKLLALYAQDDIALRPGLVVNVGTRVEYTTVPTEVHDRISNLRNVLTDTQTAVGDPFYQQPGVFFSPRVGVVWDPTGSGKTSIRAGVGMFHEPLQMKYYVVAMTRQPPFWLEIDPTGALLDGLFPNVGPKLDALTAVASQAIHVFQDNPSNPYSMQGSLIVQRQLTSTLVTEVGYVQTRGIHLPGRVDWAVPVRLIVDGETFYPTDAPYVNPSFSRLNYYDTHAESEYHALKVTVTKRASSGLHFQGAYTLSKSMDTESATVLGELGGTSAIDPYNVKLDWGPSDFNITHVFTGSMSYMLPWGKDLTGVSGALLHGWQLSSIFTTTGGRPFSVSSPGTITHAKTLLAGRPDLIAGGNDNPVYGGDPLDHVTKWFDPTQFVPQRKGFYGNLGRNTLLGPGFHKLDLSAVKEFGLGGQRTVQLRVECFNLLNTVSLSNPSSTNLFNASGARIASAGNITTTAGSARQGQIALRLAF